MRFALLMLAVGCKDGGKDPADDTDTLVPGDVTAFAAWCEDAAEAYRAWLASCLGEVQYPPGSGFVQELERRCLEASTAVAAGRIAFDGGKAATCLAAIGGRECEGGFDPFWAPECQGIFAGAVPLGGDCYGGAGSYVIVPASECAEGYCGGDECPGTCTAYPTVGQACGDVDGAWVNCDPEVAYCSSSGRCAAYLSLGDACPEGWGCAPSTECRGEPGRCVDVAVGGEACSETVPCSPSIFRCDDGVCRVKVAAGEECLMQENCGPNLVCRDVDRDGPQPMTCVDPGGLGASCQADAHCEAAFRCDTSTGDFGTCVARTAPGQTCGWSGECTAGHWCQFSLEGEGTCVAAGTEGTGCVSYGFSSVEPGACVAPLRCMADGLCHTPGGEGDPCHPFVQETCPSGLTCERASGTCQPPAGLDERCTPTFQGACEEGLGCACTARDSRCFEGMSVEPQAWHQCRPLVEDGGDCWDFMECESGQCDRTQSVEAEDPGECISWYVAPVCLGP